MINVGVFGYGTVGSGVVEVLVDNSAVIERKVGQKVNVKAVLDLLDFPGDRFADKIVHDVEAIVNDPEISVVCETMGGIGAAYKFTKMALLAGKSVCTSNKELVAAKGPELIELARQNHCSYKFEASVGGGIPIIRPLENAMTADEILSVIGIVNGTTNYMLTKMAKEGADFDAVLKEAQANGYAEAKPEADIEGYDACRKIAILSSIVYGKTVDYQDVPTEGITKVTSRDFAYASKLGMAIKLLAIYDSNNGDPYAMVAPFLLKDSNPLYHVNDVFNAILVRGNMVDDVMFYGKGAGKLPTASAVVGDVVECAKNIGTNIPCEWQDEQVMLNGMGKSKKQFFVRIKAACKDAYKELVNKSELVNAGFEDEVAFVTPQMSEEEFENTMSEKDGMLFRIRMAE